MVSQEGLQAITLADMAIVGGGLHGGIDGVIMIQILRNGMILVNLGL